MDVYSEPERNQYGYHIETVIDIIILVVLFRNEFMEYFIYQKIDFTANKRHLDVVYHDTGLYHQPYVN